jgi:hypothetical protein
VLVELMAVKCRWEIKVSPGRIHGNRRSQKANDFDRCTVLATTNQRKKVTTNKKAGSKEKAKFKSYFLDNAVSAVDKEPLANAASAATKEPQIINPYLKKALNSKNASWSQPLHPIKPKA